jgi:exportin-2 (importin alpha re-exporter)
LIESLKNNNRIIHTYSAWSIERILFLKEENNTQKYTKSDISSLSGDLLSNIFIALGYNESKENEYLMKLLMRLTSVLQEDMKKYLGKYLNILTKILYQVCGNPSNPSFNHYIFESYATVIKFNQDSIAEFEEALIKPFMEILGKNIEEFTPYVFQILSQLAEKSENAKNYAGIFKNILQPSQIWENSGNIPGIVNLICIFIKKYHESILTGIIKFILINIR